MLMFHSFHHLISIVGNIVLHILQALRVCVCVCLLLFVSAGLCKNYRMDFKKDGPKKNTFRFGPRETGESDVFCISVVFKLPS